MKKNGTCDLLIPRRLLERCRKIVFFTFFLFFLTFPMLASAYAQLRKVSFEVQNVNLAEIIAILEKSTNYTFLYQDEQVEQVKNLTFHFVDEKLSDVLKKCLAGTDLDYSIVDQTVVLKLKDTKPQEQPQVNSHKVSGVVTDKNGTPLPGVTVMIKRTTTGVATDMDGRFVLEIPQAEQMVLVCSFVGMETREVTWQGEKELTVVLTEKIAEMDEVVITGYFTRKRESYTGVANTFSGEHLREVSGQNVLSALAMVDPAFQLVENLEMGSDPNTVPAFQIRGPGSLESEYKNNPNSPTFLLDGFEVSAEKIFDLDPNRIANVTILKDAAATAIYGSRAANGVVVIETVQPAEGELTVSYSLGMDFEIADLTDYNLMNAEEKLLYEDKAKLFDGDYLSGNDTYRDEYNAKLGLIRAGVNTNWLKVPTQDVGFAHRHTLFVEGGSQKFRYGVDLNYSNKKGVMKESGREKIGVGMKFQYNTGNLRFMNYMTYDQVKEFHSPYGSFSEYTYSNPYFSPYDENGQVAKVMRGIEGIGSPLTEPNPLYNSTLGTKDEGRYKNFVNNFSVEWKIINGLNLKGQFSVSDKGFESDLFLPSEHTQFNDAEVKGSYTKNIRNEFSYDANVVLSFFRTFDKHAVNVGGVYNVRQTKTDGFKTVAYNYPNAGMDHIGMGMQYAEGDRPIGDYELSRLVGFAANVNYSYDNRYLWDGSVRSDASSIFGADKRWGTFGSVGVGWNIHNEKWVKDNTSLFQMLKLRASWGITGGTNFYPFQAMTIYSFNDPLIKGVSYGSRLGALIKGFGNTDLKWQRTEKRNIGVDFELFNRRLTGCFNAYSDISKDVLIDVNLAPSVGFTSYKENLGEVKNSGVEVNLKGTVIRIRKKRIRWDLFVNAVYNKNELLKMNDALLAYNDVQDKNTMESGNRKPIIRYQEGLSINTIWANESLGIDPSTGSEIFLNLDNEKVTAWSVKNYKPLGCTDPKVRGNFGTVLYYKNFSLNAYFAYSWGGQIYNQTLVDKVENVDPEKNADRRVLYQRWQEPGDVAYFKAIDDKTRTMPTSRFIEDNNYLTLSSLNISYEFGADVLRKLSINRLKFSLIGNELFRSSTVKMERGLTYPFARTFTFAMQVSF